MSTQLLSDYRKKESKPPLIFYTREDLLQLRAYLPASNMIAMALEDCAYDPEAFCKYLAPLKSEWEFIFIKPLSELPLTINDPRFEGWRKWRFTIGK